MSRSQKSFLNQTQAPKKDPKGPKSAKMAPNLAKLKRKRQGCTAKTNIDSLHQQVPKLFFVTDPDPSNSPKEQKIAPKGPKKYKKGPKYGQIENKKIWLYFQNQSWLSIQVGSNNFFESDPSPKNSPERPKKFKKAPNLTKLKMKR